VFPKTWLKAEKLKVIPSDKLTLSHSLSVLKSRVLKRERNSPIVVESLPEGEYFGRLEKGVLVGRFQEMEKIWGWVKKEDCNIKFSFSSCR